MTRAPILSEVTTKAGKIGILDTWMERRIYPSYIKSIRSCKARCVCGKEFVVNYSSLKTGKTHSCGCYTRKRNSFLNFKHGQTMYNNIRYKLSPTYKSLISAKQNCYNKNSKKYETHGGRGIKVCDEWMDFHNFLKDMGEKPLGYRLNRLDKEGDFEPDNCEWVKISEKKGRIR